MLKPSKKAKNTRLYSVIIVFAIVYMLYFYFILLDSITHYISYITIHILLYLLSISFMNTRIIDPGNIPRTWSKAIEDQLSKDIDKEMTFLNQNIDKTNGESTHFSLISSNKTEENFDISKFQEPESSEEDLYMQAFQIVMKEKSYKYRFCNHCDLFKPKGAHHCKSCQRCIMGLDHHNKILGVCIGMDNHKYFVLSLFYSSLVSIDMFAGFWTPGLDRISDDSLIGFCVFCLGLCISLALSIIYTLLFLFHCILILNGITMREYYRGRVAKVDGKQHSIWEVNKFLRGNYGKIWQWFIPFKTKRLESIIAYEEEFKRNPFI